MTNANKFLFSRLVGAVLTATILAVASPFLSAADFPEPGDFAQGSKVYAENCGRCHNFRSPTDLRDDQWITSTYHMRVRAGLTGQQTRDVLMFLQNSNSVSASGNRATTTTTPRVAMSTGHEGQPGVETYQQTCVACHGADGKGVLPGVPDLTSPDGPLSKSDETLFQNVLNGFQSPGSALAMPAKGGNPDLNAADIEAVVRYMREEFGR